MGRKGKDNMKQRLSYLDLVRAIAMIMVVFCHVMSRMMYDAGNTVFFNIIWLSQIPLFMLVSGMLAPSGKKVQDAKGLFFQLAKKAAVYLIPCLSYSIITSIISSSNWFHVIEQSVKNPEVNLWFLWVLFMFVFLFTIGQYIANKIHGKNALKVLTPPLLILIPAAICAIYMVASKQDLSLLGLKYFAYYSVFYIAGYFINLLLKHLSSKEIPHVGIWNLVVFLVTTAIFLFIAIYFKGIINYSDTNIRQLLIRLAGSFTSSISIILACYYLSKKFPRFIGFISKAGRYSLEIYYLHMLFLRLPFLNDFSYSVVTDPASQVWNCIWIVLLMLALCAATIAVLYFIPFLNIPVFGKSRSFYKFEKALLEKNVVGRVFLP